MAKRARGSKKAKHPSPIADAIRAAVIKKGLTGYALAQLCGGRVSRTACYRFLSDGGSTDIATAEAFFDVLGLRVVTK